MVACYLRILYISALIMYSTGLTIFDCPKSVAYGDSIELRCSNLQSLVSINNPAGKQVASCTTAKCGSEDGLEEKINITFIDNTTILLIVHEINDEDEGEWTCQSGKKANCSLNIYKLPLCEISSTSSTNNLSLGQNLPLNINLTEYYCTNNIAWDLTIGGDSQNVTGFRDREETDDISRRIVTYSHTVTSSLTGRVELTFNCNDETYAVSCSGVKELQLQGAQSSDPPITVIIVPIAVIVVGVIITVIMICRFKRNKKSSNNDHLYPDIDTGPQRKNSLKVIRNDTYTEVTDVSASPKRQHIEPHDANGDPSGGLSESVDVKGSQKELTEFRDVAGPEGNLIDKFRPRSECQMVPNPAYEGWKISDQIKTEQNENHLSCPEATYCKEDNTRDQNTGVPDILVSAKM